MNEQNNEARERAIKSWQSINEPIGQAGDIYCKGYIDGYDARNDEVENLKRKCNEKANEIQNYSMETMDIRKRYEKEIEKLKLQNEKLVKALEFILKEFPLSISGKTAKEALSEIKGVE